VFAACSPSADADGVTVTDAKRNVADVMQGNGVIHMIDKGVDAVSALIGA